MSLVGFCIQQCFATYVDQQSVVGEEVRAQEGGSHIRDQEGPGVLAAHNGYGDFSWAEAGDLAAVSGN